MSELRHGQSPTIREFNERTRSAIVRLFSVSRPQAIAWFVIALIVFSFDGVTNRWSTSHVSKEGREIAAPFLAHRDAAAAVVAIADGRLVVAPGLDAAPDSVLGRSSFAVGHQSSACRSQLLTAATLLVATTQVAGLHGAGSTTVASTQPFRRIAGASSNDRQVTESQSSHVSGPGGTMVAAR